MTKETKLETTQTAIANAIQEASPLTDAQQDQAFNCGKRASNLQIGIMENLTAYARNLGTSPTYAAWELARTQWTAGYLSDRPTIEPATADTAFSRFASQLKENFGLDKPKSDNPVAQAKAEQREKKTAELLAKYEDTSIGELNKQLEAAYLTLAKKPSDKETKKQASEIEKVIKTKQSAENKAHGEVLKTLRDEAIELVKKCVNPDVLDSVIATLESN